MGKRSWIVERKKRKKQKDREKLFIVNGCVCVFVRERDRHGKKKEN